ncbi:unnamed protein product [Dovyalis caffra]|uniref:Uncharacterized protein n=1 Tax=Dovyalis caffra TaxID=77055 RepID=A0AAV1RFF3_9ROSI|nr:unnamed protein product [Dovyalis caffra]
MFRGREIGWMYTRIGPGWLLGRHNIIGRKEIEQPEDCCGRAIVIGGWLNGVKDGGATRNGFEDVYRCEVMDIMKLPIHREDEKMKKYVSYVENLENLENGMVDSFGNNHVGAKDLVVYIVMLSPRTIEALI